MNEIEAIFEEVRSTYSLISDPTNLQFLEIDPTAVTSQEIGFDRTGRLNAWKQLKNSVISIDDIQNSRQGLSFVGVLGHFTSGKSSLINALLEIGPNETPGYKRKVGPHPTDVSITLICHQNAREILESNAITSINDVNIVHGPSLPFLDGIVLVDTPGLGNAEAEHELAERFLHLCHVIIITVDAMVPFADTDKDFALLDKAFNRLAGVPKIFAVTKSSAFLTHRQGEYETDWDEENATAFWREALERMVSDGRFRGLKGHLETIPVYFVDSVDNYKIDELKNGFVPITQDQSQKERIFRAKVDYVVDVTREAIGIFEQHLEGRLANLNKLYEEARKRAAVAENSIHSQLVAVQSAITTASKKLQEHEAKIAKQEAISTVPLPDKELLFDRYESFSACLAELGQRSSHIERETVARIRREARSHTEKIHRLFFPATREIDAAVFDSNARVGGQEWAESDVTNTIAELEHYYHSSAKHVAERIRNKQNTELFFMRFDDDKSLLTEVLQSVSGGLGQFVRAYNSAATQFVAYLTQPNSRDVLAEYGLILFDKNEEIEIRAATLEVGQFPAWRHIGEVVELAKDRIDQFAVETQAAEKDASVLEDFYPTDSPFGDDFSLAALCWSSVYDERLEPAINELAANIKPVLDEGAERQQLLRQEIAGELFEIWMGRFELIVRMVVVFGLTWGLMIGLKAIDTALYVSLTQAVLSDWKGIMFGVIGTLIVTALSFVFVGPKHAGLKKPFSTELRPIIRYFRDARRNKRLLAEKTEQLVKQLEAQLRSTPLNLPSKVHRVVTEWFQQSEICKPLKRTGDRIQKLQAKRRSTFADDRNTITGDMNALASEGSKIAHKKREESVERVLGIITDKRDLIVALREELRAKLERLT